MSQGGGRQRERQREAAISAPIDTASAFDPLWPQVNIKTQERWEEMLASKGLTGNSPEPFFLKPFNGARGYMGGIVISLGLSLQRCLSQLQWHTPVTPVFGSWKQTDQSSRFTASLWPP